MHLTDKEKWGIIHEWERTQNIAAIARNPHMPSLKCIKRWVGVYQRTGTVSGKKSSGRPSRISAKAAKVVVELLQDHKEFGTARTVAMELHKRGLTQGAKPVSNITLLRAAKAQSIRDGDELQLAKGGLTKELTLATKQKRLDFAKANLSTNWACVLFSDRKKFAFRYPGTRATTHRWIKKSQGGKAGYKCFQPNNPQRVNLYMGMCKWGVTKVHKVAGSKGYQSPFKNQKGQQARNITSAEYKHVLKKTLLPEGSRLFSQQGLSTFKFQQDNDPAHVRSAPAEVKAWNDKHPGKAITLLPNWPPNSPDLNPIENVWGIVQREVDAAGCSSFDQFEAMVTQKLQSFPQKTLEKLVNSMSKRIKLVIEANGDKIKY